MKFEYINEIEVPEICRNGGRRSQTMIEVKKFLKTDKEAIKFEYDTKKEVNSAYNCLYAKFVRRNEDKCPIKIARRELTLYVIRVKDQEQNEDYSKK